MGPPHEGSIRLPIAPWANTLTTELHLTPKLYKTEDLNIDLELDLGQGQQMQLGRD